MATGCRPNSSPSTSRSSGSPSATSVPFLYSRVRAWHLVGVARQIADAATVSGSLPWKVMSLGALVPSWPPSAPSGSARREVMKPRMSPQLLPGRKRLLDHRVVVGAEHPPVLAFGQDLLRAADGAEVAGAGGRLLADLGQALGRAQQLPVHPDHRHVGRPQVLPGPVVDRAGRLGGHAVMRPEFRDAAVRDALLRDPVDPVVVLPGVVARHEPGERDPLVRVLLVGGEQG